jgi:hypothetical protein
MAPRQTNALELGCIAMAHGKILVARQKCMPLKHAQLRTQRGTPKIETSVFYQIVKL